MLVDGLQLVLVGLAQSQAPPRHPAGRRQLRQKRFKGVNGSENVSGEKTMNKDEPETGPTSGTGIRNSTGSMLVSRGTNVTLCLRLKDRSDDRVVPPLFSLWGSAYRRFFCGSGRHREKNGSNFRDTWPHVRHVSLDLNWPCKNTFVRACKRCEMMEKGEKEEGRRHCQCSPGRGRPQTSRFACDGPAMLRQQ